MIIHYFIIYCALYGAPQCAFMSVWCSASWKVIPAFQQALEHPLYFEWIKFFWRQFDVSIFWPSAFCTVLYCDSIFIVQLSITYIFLSELHIWEVEFHFQKSLCSRKPFSPPNRYMQSWWATDEWLCLGPGPCWELPNRRQDMVS